jgi:Protein of unknown function (DUF3987)
MEKLIPSSIKNPCPVCGRTKDTDCRTTTDSVFVLCHTHQQKTDVEGWVWRGECLTGAAWGMYSKQEKISFVSTTSKVEYTSYFYPRRDGSPLVRVTKKILIDGRKEFYQSSWVDGQWQNTLGAERESIAIYRYAEVRKAIDNGELIWWVEGEDCADVLWELGIPATTSIGGSAGLHSYGQYLADLEGASIVICPDKDLPGIKYGDGVESVFIGQISGWAYCFDNSLWQRLGERGGADLADEIRQNKLDRAAVYAKLGEKKAIVPRATETTQQPNQARSVTSTQLIAEVDALITNGTYNGTLRAEIAVLAKKYSISTVAIWDIYQERSKDAEFSEDKAQILADINKSIDSKNFRLKVAALLPNPIASSLCMVAALLGLMPETYLMGILSAVGALQNAASRIEVCPATGWYEPSNLYTAIVAESSQRKTPIFKEVIHRPLKRLMQRSAKSQELAQSQYELDLHKWSVVKAVDRLDNFQPKPTQPIGEKFLTTDPSTEGMIKQAAAHPHRTLLYCRDELSGIFGDMNKYRGGKGSDRELMLEAYSGAMIEGLRASGENVSVNEMLLGVFGGIQPKSLSKLMGDGQDIDGMWGRFLMVVQPTVEAPMLPEYGTKRSVSLSDELANLYEKIADLPAQTYTLTEDAYNLFRDFRQELERMRCDKSISPLQAHFAGKNQGTVARIALNLHVIWSLAAGKTPSIEIGIESIARAISIVKFCIGQIELIGCEIHEGQNVPTKILKLIELGKSQPLVSVRDTNRKVERRSSDAARTLMGQAVELGYFQWVGVKSIELLDRIEPVPRPQNLAVYNLEKLYEQSDNYVEVDPATPTAVVEDSTDIILERIPSPVATLMREPKRGDRVKQIPHEVNGKHVRCLVSVVGNKHNPRGWFTVDGFEILREDWGKWWFLIEKV